jgi:hypothetical protein
MKKYEYKLLRDVDTYAWDLEDLNDLGQQGWRVVSWEQSDSGKESVLLEKETNE